MEIPPPEVRYTESPRVACDGDLGPLGHPRVWLQIGADGFVDCGYCDRRFILVGGPADERAEGSAASRPTPGSGDLDRVAPGATEPDLSQMSES